jgi:hypothetical protein
MRDFEIDFEWPLAPKYEFRPASAEELSKIRPEDLQRVREAERAVYFGRIVSVGKAKDHRPTTDAMEKVVRALVECKETPIHIVALKVARVVGTLWPGFPSGEFGLMDPWRNLAQELRFIFEGRFVYHGKEYKWPDPVAQYKGDLGIYLVPDKNNNPVLALRPGELRAALVLYAARMKATGTTFNICENCKTPFLSGGTRFRNKRGDAKFCSDECRWKYHNETRRKHR